jgi:transcriptional regulator with XRE-family HTH domain
MKIIILRKALGITQSQLAEKSGTTQQQIARIENGVVDPRLSTLRRIANALKCELPELFFSRDEFIKIVRDTAARHKIKLREVGILQLNSLCAKEHYIPSFHPFWEKVEIKNNTIILTED